MKISEAEIVHVLKRASMRLYPPRLDELFGVGGDRGQCLGSSGDRSGRLRETFGHGVNELSFWGLRPAKVDEKPSER
jgi:hypothetical protein